MRRQSLFFFWTPQNINMEPQNWLFVDFSPFPRCIQVPCLFWGVYCCYTVLIKRRLVYVDKIITLFETVQYRLYGTQKVSPYYTVVAANTPLNSRAFPLVVALGLGIASQIYQFPHFTPKTSQAICAYTQPSGILTNP